MKPIGFLQEDFHSEVLDFLIELFVNRNPGISIILYNNVDRYNNKSILIKKYKNFIVKPLNKFIPDMVSNFCEKIIVVSYDNIFHLDLLEPYKKDLIFVAHSPKHITQFDLLNINYFSLTGLLSSRYMTPFIKDPVPLIKIKLEQEEILKKLVIRISIEKLTVLVIIGSFFENNKNIKLIKELVSTGKFIIIIFTAEVSKLLYDFIKIHEKFVFAALNQTTTEIQNNIEMLNARYILFAPPDNSQFFSSSWSGCISFAFDNNLTLIMPKQLADYYNIGYVIGYHNVNDIINGIKNNVNVNSMQKTRNNVYIRNNIVLDVLFGKFLIPDPDPLIENYSAKHLVDINPELYNLNCKKTTYFISDLSLAKKYKKLVIYNDLLNSTKIYNNELGGNITLDSLDLKNVDIIRIGNVKNVNEILNGAMNLIKENSPMIFLKGKIDIVLPDYTKIYIDGYTRLKKN